MLQPTPKHEASGNGAEATYRSKERRQVALALVLLLTALLVVVVKNRGIWLGTDEDTTADEASPVTVPNTVAKQVVAPAAKTANHVSKNSARTAQPRATQSGTVVATTRTVLPPLGIEVVAGKAQRTIHLANSSPEVAMAPQPSATSATQQFQMASEREQVTAASDGRAYPLLAQQMKVQGSVLLQALIGADGVIRDLRVLSGPAILASAAREAVREWRFKPYVQNGRAVETSANITVNFTIKVSDKPSREPSTVALVTSGE
jgi:TonB family protein